MYNVIILGSGRSGTSMLTGILAKAGYFIGEDSYYLKINSANPKGFFEDYEVNTINEDILNENLITIPEPIRKRIFPSFTFYRARWLSRLPLNKIIQSTKEINKRIQALIKKEPFCYKDPRFSYTLPIWSEYLNSNTKFIVVFREPNKTADSIVRECQENKALNKLKMTKKSALKIWISMYSHVLKNYKQSSNQEDWLFFHYNHIFNKEKVLQLEAFLDLKLNVDFAEKNISRSVDDNQYSNPKADAIYNNLIILS